MDKIIQIIGIAVLGNMIAYWFLPIQQAKRWAINKSRYLSSSTFATLDKALNCSKCMSFWLFLIVSAGDIVGAALCSFVGYMINYTIDKTQSWYEG